MATRVERDTDGPGAQRHPDAPISRRRFIQGAVAVSAAAGAAAWPAKAEGGASPAAGRDPADAANADGDAGRYRVLTPAQGRALVTVLNRIIPAAGVMPGAGDAGVARFIDGVLADAPHLRPCVVSLLHEADAGGRFADLAAAGQDARLRALAGRRTDEFGALLRVAYTGYYGDPGVLTAMGRSPDADATSAPAPFDVRRLDAVRKRGPMYRNGGAA